MERSTSILLGVNNKNVDEQRRRPGTTRYLRRFLLAIMVIGVYFPLGWNSMGVPHHETSRSSSTRSSFDLDTPWFNLNQPPFDRLRNRRYERRRQTMTKERFHCTMKNGVTLDTPVFPHFIIAGAQKGGTTAISKLLSKVPSLLASTEFEPHFWSYRIYHLQEWSLGQRCHAIARYRQYFDAEQMLPGRLVYEKTPVLLAMPKVPKTIHDVLAPHLPKIIVILRDPVDRFYSEYKMEAEVLHRKNKTIAPIATLINHEMLAYHAQGLLTDFPLLSHWSSSWSSQQRRHQQAQEAAIMTITITTPPASPPPTQVETFELRKYKSFLARGFYSKQLPHYLTYFPLGTHLHVVHYENFNTNKTKILNEILEFVGAEPFEWHPHHLDKNLGPYRARSDPSVYQPEQLSNETRLYLKALYKPFNDELVSVLGDEWQDAWES